LYQQIKEKMESKTIAQFLGIKDFPYEIKDNHGKTIYYEQSNGFWWKQEYDSNGKQIYFENSNGYWVKHEFDSKDNEIYWEDSNGYWAKQEFDSSGNVIYYENSNGNIRDKRPKVIELTLEDIANKFGTNVSNIKIKK